MEMPREPWEWEAKFDWEDRTKIINRTKHFRFSNRFWRGEEKSLRAWIQHWEDREVRYQVVDNVIWLNVQDFLKAFNMPLEKRIERLLDVVEADY